MAYWATTALALTCVGAQAQEHTLDEIIVVATPATHRALQPVRIIDSAELERRIPIVAADIFRGVSAVGVRTNSRGETVVRIRSAEERQVQIFLDGAPLGVPWDGRVDLGILPAGMIESARVTTSAAPIEYGPNAVLGVIDLTSLSPERSGIQAAQLEGGPYGTANASLAASVRSDDLSIVGAVSHVRRDDLPTSARSAIPFAPLDGDRRVNTDLASTSAFGAVGIERSSGAVRFSVLTATAERGIAPAGHLDPALDPPRYWRYPETRFTQATLNAALTPIGIWSLRGVAWYQDFAQAIDQYSAADYATRQAREDDADVTVGTRLVAGLEQPRWGLRAIANLQRSTHRQTDTHYNNASTTPEAVFRQDLMSLGGESDIAITSALKLSISGSYDRVDSPLTGGRATQPALSDWAGAAALRWSTNPDWSLTTTLGRRTRFATLRELYGEALGEFIPNPQLQPETATLADITAAWTPNHDWRGELNLWASHLTDTLARRTVRVNGQRFRQRYNQAGTRGHGVEAHLRWEWSQRTRLEWNGAWQNLTTERETTGVRPPIYQRPDLQTSLALDTQPNEAWDARFEIEHVGVAKDEGSDGSPVTLPASTQLHLRAFYTPGGALGKWTLYAAVENLTDELVLPQLGLPAAGRIWRVGVRLATHTD